LGIWSILGFGRKSRQAIFRDFPGKIKWFQYFTGFNCVVAKSETLGRWQAGTPLSEAWRVFTNGGSPPKRTKTQKIATKEYPPKSGMGILLARLDDAQSEGLVTAIGAFKTFTDSVREESAFNNHLKNEFLKRLQKGELLAFGYSINTAATAPPIQIPHRFFIRRFFKFELDVISDPPFEFRQVRITWAEKDVQKTPLTQTRRPGRPSLQDTIFDALRALAAKDPSFEHKQRKIQAAAIQEFVKTIAGRAPSVRTISKSIPFGLQRLKQNSTD
jgi:hypothetical protein